MSEGCEGVALVVVEGQSRVEGREVDDGHRGIDEGQNQIGQREIEKKQGHSPVAVKTEPKELNVCLNYL